VSEEMCLDECVWEVNAWKANLIGADRGGISWISRESVSMSCIIVLCGLGMARLLFTCFTSSLSPW
jgi:hypothetical protein